MAQATFIIDGKKVEVDSTRMVITHEQGDGTSRSMVLNMSRTEQAALSTAIKEASKQK